MKWIVVLLSVLLVALQTRLWVGEGSLAQNSALVVQLEAQQAKNDTLRVRNDLLDARVQELKNGLGTIEELARIELGMIKENETFFLVIDR